MHSPHPRDCHPGMTMPEALGVITCLSIGLFGGCWLFCKDISQLLQIAAVPENSTAVIEKVATSGPEIFEGELEQHLGQTDAGDSEREFAAPAAVATPEQPINEADVRALLGETDNSALVAGNKSATSTAIEYHAATTGAETAKPTGEKTLAYWNAMNNIMAEEEHMRTPPMGGVTQENAADFIARRGQASLYATAELRGLDRTGVDPAVISLGEEIANWYTQGSRLNDKATSLLNASDATRQGQTGRNWGNSEKSHNASVSELNRRGDALRMKMIQKYGLKFPDLR